MGANSPGFPGPDLRESAVAFDVAALQALLLEGGREAMGMPRFDEMSAERVHDIYLYIRAMAREALDSAT